MTRPYKGLLRTKPFKGFYLCFGILTTRKRVYKFLYANWVGYFVLLQLVLYVRLDRFLVAACRIHKIPFCLKVPVLTLILQVRMPIKYHQAAFSFQVSHNLGYAVLRQDAYQHMDVLFLYSNLETFSCLLFPSP